MITQIEDYFAKGCGRCPRFDTPDCSTRPWAGVLAGLRRLCLDAGLTEVVKWGHPTYMAGGRNVAILGAFRDNVRLTLFEAALFDHPALERQGPNTRHPDMICLRAPADLDRLSPTIAALLAEARAHAEAGRRAPREARSLDWPEELIDTLDMDPELAEAFHALTPGRQTSHILHLTSTANSATRIARLGRNRDKILAGKGATER